MILPDIQEDDLLQIRKVLDRFKRHKSNSEIFYDLCFCISVPQVSFVKTHEVIKKLKDRQFFEKFIELKEFYELTRPLRFKRKAD